MCWKRLRKNRNWSLWLSGVFAAKGLANLALALFNQPINAFGIMLDRNVFLLRFVAHLAIAYLLLMYWEKAQAKKRKK